MIFKLSVSCFILSCQQYTVVSFFKKIWEYLSWVFHPFLFDLLLPILALITLISVILYCIFVCVRLRALWVPWPARKYQLKPMTRVEEVTCSSGYPDGSSRMGPAQGHTGERTDHNQDVLQLIPLQLTIFFLSYVSKIWSFSKLFLWMP